MKNLSKHIISLLLSFGLFLSAGLTYGENLVVDGNLTVSNQNSNTDLILKNAGGSNNSLLWWVNSSGSGNYYLGQVNENSRLQIYNYFSDEMSMVIHTGNDVAFSNNRLFIQASSGNIGIGTTNPGAKLDVQGQVIGGFGALTTAGVQDWNDSSNARAGSGYTLLMGNAANGPGPSVYFHPFSFEYGSKNGLGNMLQLALPYYTTYGNGRDSIWMRSRYQGNWTGWRKILSEDAEGNVGIGTLNTGSYKLAVEGKIGAREVVVTQAAWADFVFEDNYNLSTLTQVESFIKKNKHLPDIPSAKQVEEEGLSMAEMMKKQMQKIEELTLYVIELKKENDEIKKELTEMQKNMN
ncbi:MAG: hypothetical protein PVG39_11960 [Desulfobacteraceae bacterium]|jgi:hypothetical protein